jgi:hypothetical protein
VTVAGRSEATGLGGALGSSPSPARWTTSTPPGPSGWRREPVSLWHADADLKNVDAVWCPAVSYGDYLRAGATPASRR